MKYTEHSCTQQDKLEVMAISLAKIEQAILGNGQPGLCQRVQKLEDGLFNVASFGIAAGIAIGAGVTWLIKILKV